MFLLAEKLRGVLTVKLNVIKLTFVRLNLNVLSNKLVGSRYPNR